MHYASAVVIVAVAAVLRWRLVDSFGPLPTFLTFYPAVLLVASIGGGGPGILATVLSALAADYWFIPPYGSFRVEAPNDVLALGIFTGTGLFLSVLAERLRRARWAEAVSVAQEQQLEELSRLNEELSQQSEELSQQSEELAQQNEELQTQSEEIQTLNTELTHREDLLQKLLDAARLGTAEQAVMQEICAAAKEMFGPAASAVIVLEPQGEPAGGPRAGRAGAGGREGRIVARDELLRGAGHRREQDGRLGRRLAPPGPRAGPPSGRGTVPGRPGRPDAHARDGPSASWASTVARSRSGRPSSSAWPNGWPPSVPTSWKPCGCKTQLARLAAIVESSDDAILSKDLNGIIQTWNAGAERLFGYRAEEVVGQPITLLLPPERIQEEEQILERAAERPARGASGDGAGGQGRETDRRVRDRLPGKGPGRPDHRGFEDRPRHHRSQAGRRRAGPRTGQSSRGLRRGERRHVGHP